MAINSLHLPTENKHEAIVLFDEKGEHVDYQEVLSKDWQKFSTQWNQMDTHGKQDFVINQILTEFICPINHKKSPLIYLQVL